MENYSQEKNQIIIVDILLDTIEWKNDEAIIFGKLIITKRKVAWYGDLDLNIPIQTPQKKHFHGR